MTKLTLIPALLTSAFLTGCASGTIKVETVPSGASVFIEGKEVGKTPLTLKESDFREQFKTPFVQLRFEAKQHEPLISVVATEGAQELTLSLRPLSEDYFDKVILENYQSQVNGLTRELLKVQGYLINKKYDEAEKLLNAFMAKYPNVAASYLFKANIELSRNNKEQAMRNLERAASLDPNDATVARVIETMKKGTD